MKHLTILVPLLLVFFNVNGQNKDFASSMNHLMQLKNFTLTEMSDCSGFSKDEIKKFLTGTVTPDVEGIYRIGTCLDAFIIYAKDTYYLSEGIDIELWIEEEKYSIRCTVQGLHERIGTIEKIKSILRTYLNECINEDKIPSVAELVYIDTFPFAREYEFEILYDKKM